MTITSVTVGNRSVQLLTIGKGPPVLYLHGLYDVHSAQAELYPFHEALADHFTLIIPAHPGCGDSTGINDIIDIEDLAFHYLDVLDALGIAQATIVGHCLGGWIATEMAVRNPERIGRLALIGAAGLQVPGAPVGDYFMYSQNRDGGIMQEQRALFFADPDGVLAHSIIPDGRVAIPDEVRRYKTITLAGRVGWEPPYLHDRKLAARLHRVSVPTLLLWGEQDRLIPPANGRAYATGLPHAAFETIDGGGHAVIIEQPAQCVERIVPFLHTGALRATAVASA